MSNIITGGVLRVCSFVVKCFREIGGGEMGYILFLSGVSVTNFYIFTALKHIC